LYLFYNADLLDIAIDEDGLRHGLVIGYIDDISIMVNGRNTEEITKTLLMLHERAEKWAHRHASVFAPQKYKLIHFVRPRKKASEEERKRPLALTLKDGRTQIVQPTTKARYLGVILDDKLTGKAHLDYVAERSTS
jgi:hypothetical protein